MWNRLNALIIKEVLALLRDPWSRIALTAPPLLQLFVFSFTGTQEVRNIRLVILDRDHGQPASELVQRLAASPNFATVYVVRSPQQLRHLIDSQRVILGVQVPSDFSKRFYTNDNPSIQVVLDGRRSMAAQIAQGYLTSIVGQFSRDQNQPVGGETNAVLVESRNWFNPNLEYLWFTVPSLVVIITLQMSINITTISVPREREMGTFDQLLVSPLQPIEIMIGKMVPAFLLALSEATLFVLVTICVFHIPCYGSLAWLYLALVIFVSSVLGIGLLISIMCTTQQQALLATMAVMMPALILSGYTNPIENMPGWLQLVTYGNPLRYMMIIVRGVFLKGMTTEVIMTSVWPMAAIAVGTLSIAALLFRRRLA